jgi:hypothetical protein
MVANEQSAEVFTAAFKGRLTANRGHLLLGEFYFNPGTAGRLHR